MKDRFDLDAFVDFVLTTAEIDPDRPINHAGWCSCAVGEFLEADKDFDPDYRVTELLNEAFGISQEWPLIIKALNGSAYGIAPEREMPTYGHLASYIKRVYP